jgi:RNA polymerase sigma-70 factor, ECF subfamily
MNHPDDQQSEFVLLLAKHERQLSGYVHTLVPSWQDAEDVLQDTKLRLWQQFDSFRREADFVAWAVAIAHYMIQTHRRNCQRQRVCFSDDVLDRISRHVPTKSSSLQEDRASALVECVKMLNDASRKLLRRFCTGHARLIDIARELGQAPSTTRVALLRIRRTLFECVQQRVQEGEGR